MDVTSKIIGALHVPESAILPISAVCIIVGFVLLIKGADYFVDGAVKAAVKLNVPLIVIGLTIVAMGTSAPEAAVSITAAAKGNAGLAIGNAVGSNIFNILVILGVTGLFAKLPAQTATVYFEIPFVFAVSATLTVLGSMGGELSRFDALVILGFFCAFIAYIVYSVKKGAVPPPDGELPTVTERDSAIWIVVLILGGLAAIILGSDMAVFGAEKIALAANVSPRIIGLTILAVGTSAPEFITSAVAARKGKADLAIGNIVGSNIFNIACILGISGVVSPAPLTFSAAFGVDCAVLMVSVLILWLLMFKKKALGKKGAVTLLACYAAYMVYLFVT